jgi:hypothetical protein
MSPEDTKGPEPLLRERKDPGIRSAMEPQMPLMAHLYALLARTRTIVGSRPQVFCYDARSLLTLS